MNIVNTIKISSLGLLLCALPLETSADTVTLPAGMACSDFDLSYDTSGGNRQIKEFKDAEGNVVRILETGTGAAVTFTNLSTGKTYSTKSNGANSQTRYSADGSYTVAATGHNVIILFPTDIPAGPSTTLYVGRVVYSVDTNGVWSMQSNSGKTSDICEILSY